MGGFAEDYKAPSTMTMTGKNMKALTKYAPRLAALNEELSNQYNPLTEARNFKLFSEYTPQYLETGGRAQTAEDLRSGLGAISNEAAMINGGGSQLVEQANQMEALANPEWYANKQAVGAGYSALLGGMDPNKLSGAEMANVERGVNRLNMRTGNLNTGDSTTTTANAMQFGGALDQKRQNFGQALSLFPGIAGATRSQNNGFDIATGRGAKQGQNAGAGLGANQNSGMNSALSASQGSVNDLQALGYNINSQRDTTFNKMTTLGGATESL